MNIIENFSEKHIQDLHGLYHNEWWSKDRSLEETRKGIKGSQITIGITNPNDELIGFTRVLTDYIFKALIFDVIVRSDYRKIGLGKALFGAVLKHPRLSSVKHFELYCLDDISDFYRKFGFSGSLGKIKLMRLIP